MSEQPSSNPLRDLLEQCEDLLRDKRLYINFWGTPEYHAFLDQLEAVTADEPAQKAPGKSTWNVQGNAIECGPMAASNRSVEPAAVSSKEMLVSVLRAVAEHTQLFSSARDLLRETADEIERLEKRLDDWYSMEARIRAALADIVGDDVYLEALHKIGAEPETHNPKLTVEPPAVPSAWMRGVSSHVPGEPSEYAWECYAGDEPPDNREGWIPLYRRPVETDELCRCRDVLVMDGHCTQCHRPIRPPKSETEGRS